MNCIAARIYTVSGVVQRWLRHLWTIILAAMLLNGGAAVAETIELRVWMRDDVGKEARRRNLDAAAGAVTHAIRRVGNSDRIVVTVISQPSINDVRDSEQMILDAQQSRDKPFDIFVGPQLALCAMANYGYIDSLEIAPPENAGFAAAMLQELWNVHLLSEIAGAMVVSSPVCLRGVGNASTPYALPADRSNHVLYVSKPLLELVLSNGGTMCTDIILPMPLEDFLTRVTAGTIAFETVTCLAREAAGLAGIPAQPITYDESSPWPAYLFARAAGIGDPDPINPLKLDPELLKNLFEAVINARKNGGLSPLPAAEFPTAVPYDGAVDCSVKNCVFGKLAKLDHARRLRELLPSTFDTKVVWMHVPKLKSWAGTLEQNVTTAEVFMLDAASTNKPYAVLTIAVATARNLFVPDPDIVNLGVYKTDGVMYAQRRMGHMSQAHAFISELNPLPRVPQHHPSMGVYIDTLRKEGLNKSDGSITPPKLVEHLNSKLELIPW